VRAAVDTQVLPLLAWRPEQLEEVASAFEAVCRSWAADWGLSPQERVSCRRPERVDVEKEWQCVESKAETSAWIHCPPALADVVGQDLFGAAPVSSPIARHVVAACIASLQLRLSGLVAGSPHGHRPVPAPQALAAWSGWVCVTLSAGGMVLLDDRSARALMAPVRVPRREPLRTMVEALGGSGITLQVQLHACELDLGSLQDLRPGDVLRVPHSLDDPAAVVDADGRAVLRGLLVRSGSRKAIELTSRA
jgi:hypothetical protein